MATREVVVKVEWQVTKTADVAWAIDETEYAEWRGGQPDTPWVLRQFIRSGRFFDDEVMDAAARVKAWDEQDSELDVVEVNPA